MTEPIGNSGDKGLKTIDQFCAQHSLSRSTFYRMLRRNEIDTVTVGTARRIAPEQERRWLDKLLSAA